MAGVLQGYIFNGFTRIMHQVPYWIVPFGIGESASVLARSERSEVCWRYGL